MLLRHDRIGDWVITTPLIEELHRAFPLAEIDVLGSSANAPIIAVDDRITRVHVWSGSLVQRLAVVRRCRSLRYDAALQLLLGETTKPALLLRLCAPEAIMVGQHDPRGKFAFDSPVMTPGEHFAIRTLGFAAGLIAEWSGPETVRYSLRIPASARERAMDIIRRQELEAGAFVLVNVSAGTPDRCIGAELATAIVAYLREAGEVVAVSGEPKDFAVVDEVCRNTGAVELTAGTLIDALALYHFAEAVITPDTAMVHVASASDRPVVALFGERGDPVGWGPHVDHHRTLLAAPETTVTAGIAPERVVEATLDLLQRVRRR